MRKALVHLAAIAAFAFGLPAAAAAQIQTVDPDSGSAWAAQPPADPSGPPADAPLPADETDDASVADPGDAAPPPSSDSWTPIGPPGASPTPSDSPSGPPTSPTTASQTVPRDDIFQAAEGVFGRGAEGLAGILEDILREQGEPIAYISGQEAGGAFILGVRYGSGIMRHRTAGDRTVYWTGPSIGFDVGADASKVFVLVYNLNDAQQLFRRYPSGEGRAYFVGGFSANYLRRGDVVLIPVRLGVGLRLGINAGYMRFSDRNRWLPF